MAVSMNKTFIDRLKGYYFVNVIVQKELKENYLLDVKCNASLYIYLSVLLVFLRQ